MSLMATVAAQMAFMEASLLGRSELLCEPTMTTGTGVFSMKERAAAVYIMVSVPWVMITPSAPCTNLLSHSARELHPVFGAHVLAQDLIDHAGIVVGDLLQLRDGGDDLAGRELAGDGSRAVIDLAGNGSSCG